MMSNPKPLQPIRALFGKCAVMKANASGVKDAHLLESQGRMAWIYLKKCEVLVGEFPDVLRELPVMEPKIRIGKVIQSGVQRPAS